MHSTTNESEVDRQNILLKTTKSSVTGREYRHQQWLDKATSRCILNK